MDITNILEPSKFVIFLIFVVPGFICLKTYELLLPTETRSSSERIIDAITYSSINYGLLAIFIWLIEIKNIHEKYPWGYYSFYLFVLFCSPILLAFFWVTLRKRNNFLRKHLTSPTGKAWDYVFLQRKPYWIKVFLENGTVVAGIYGKNSFASGYPNEEQIYLEQTWFLDEKNNFLRKKEGSKGVIILSKEISHIELKEF